MAQQVKKPPEMQVIQVQFWVRKIPWRRKWQLTPVFLPEKSHGQIIRASSLIINSTNKHS